MSKGIVVSKGAVVHKRYRGRYRSRNSRGSPASSVEASLRCHGFVLAETLIALAVITLVVMGVSGVLLANHESLRRVATTLESERILTTAQITVLVMVREGRTATEIHAEIERRHPGVTVEAFPEGLVLETGDRTLEISLKSGRGSW